MNLEKAKRILRGIAIGLPLLGTATLHAGGPFIIGGPTFGVEGQPFVWDNTRSIQYWTDTGPLGTVGNSTANSMVAQGFQSWAHVPTASISFTRAGSIGAHPGTLSELDTLIGSCNSGSMTPIIYDDGTLLQQLTGDDGVVGLAGPCLLSRAGKIQSAFAILGNPPGMPPSLLPAVILHELGHFIGLDHTDIRIPSSTGTTQADVDATPTMFYMLFSAFQGSAYRRYGMGFEALSLSKIRRVVRDN
jgi:hypothetical protein